MLSSEKESGEGEEGGQRAGEPRVIQKEEVRLRVAVMTEHTRGQ